MNDQVIKVNLIPNTGTPAVAKVSQYDVGRPLQFVILDGATRATLAAGTRVYIKGTKPSGLGFSVYKILGVGGSTITFQTNLAMTQECGRIPCELRVVDGDDDIGTANFILAVEKTPHADGTTDGTQETMQNLETRLQTEIDGLDDRIEALENAEESGLTAQEKSLILTLFSKAAYAEDDAKSTYDTLEGLWRVVYRTITYNLTNCISTSSVTSVESNKPYSTNLATQTGYTITSATVTMGGADVTASVYSNGAISIPQVTGDVVITAVASKKLSSITATYTQSGTVYDTDTLDSLKSDLVVTANYSDSTSETVTGYTLSGTLTIGTSTVTVSYGGKTATFSVTVSHSALPSEYTKYDYIYKATSGNPTPIVTDAQLTSDYSLEMEFMIPTGTTSTASAILGTRTAAYGTKEIALFITQTTGKLGYWYAGKDSSTNITISNDVVHTIKVLPVGKSTTYPSNAVIDVDGTEYNTTSNTTGQTWSAWFGIFGYAASATTASAGTQNFMRIGEIIIKDTNGDAVYDFVPVSRNDNKNGFYETVNGTFYEATDMTVGNWE